MSYKPIGKICQHCKEYIEFEDILIVVIERKRYCHGVYMPIPYYDMSIEKCPKCGHVKTLRDPTREELKKHFNQEGQ